MKEKFNIYHWEFFLNDDNLVEVYEERDGDVIGCIDCFDLDYIKDYTRNLSEDQVYNFIDSVIEYY